MVRLLPLLLLTGCVSIPNLDMHQEALSNFTYKRDIGDTWIAYESIKQPFEGDCEDYAFTLQKAIGGDVVYVVHNTEGAHAVLVKDGYVYDNLSAWPVKVGDYPGVFKWIMVYGGGE